MPTGCCPLPEGAVVIRGADPEEQLQGLRTALSLALGDRPARVYVTGPGRAVLASDGDSEAGRCLVALREAGIPVIAEGAGVTRVEILVQSGAASFQQTF
jgi:hypothetical protein